MRKWIAVIGLVVLAAAVGAVAATLTDRLAFEAVAAPQLQWPLDSNGDPLPGPFVNINCDSETGDRLYVAAYRATPTSAVTVQGLAVVPRGCADWPVAASSSVAYPADRAFGDGR